MSTNITREEFEDKKKELLDLKKKREDLLDAIEKERRERDERISAEELQAIMLPVDILNRQINEVTYLIKNARIIQNVIAVQQEEIEEVLADEQSENAELQPAENAASVDIVPRQLFFFKDGAKAKAQVGDQTPFYAMVDGEYIGYNRLLMNGWQLMDDTGRVIDDTDEIWSLRNSLKESEWKQLVKSTREKYPNAFARWTQGENEKLLDLYSEQGKTVDEIAQEMGRTRHGISLQLRKLLGVNRLPYRKKQKAPATYNRNPVSITSIDPADIPDDEMAAYLDKIALLEEWFKAVKAFAAQQAIENGVFYDGYEIKTTFRNTFSDASATLETLRTQFPDQFDACIQPKSVSSIKKTLGEELFNSTLAGLVNQQEKKSLVKSKG